MEKMFCFQCQETAKGSGCTVRGVCGKTPDVANLQDLLLFLLKGIAHYRVQLRALKAVDHSADQFILDGLFMTITNANFDRDRFIDKIKRALLLRERLKQTFLDKKGDIRNIKFEGAYWQCDSTEEMEQKATTIGVLSTLNEDVRALRELLIYGIKGIGRLHGACLQPRTRKSEYIRIHRPGIGGHHFESIHGTTYSNGARMR